MQIIREREEKSRWIRSARRFFANRCSLNVSLTLLCGVFLGFFVFLIFRQVLDNFFDSTEPPQPSLLSSSCSPKPFVAAPSSSDHWILIGVPTVQRASQNYLISTLESLLAELPRDPVDPLYGRVGILVSTVTRATGQSQDAEQKPPQAVEQVPPSSSSSSEDQLSTLLSNHGGAEFESARSRFRNIPFIYFLAGPEPDWILHHPISPDKNRHNFHRFPPLNPSVIDSDLAPTSEPGIEVPGHRVSKSDFSPRSRLRYHRHAHHIAVLLQRTRFFRFSYFMFMEDDFTLAPTPLMLCSTSCARPVVTTLPGLASAFHIIGLNGLIVRSGSFPQSL